MRLSMENVDAVRAERARFSRGTASTPLQSDLLHAMREDEAIKRILAGLEKRYNFAPRIAELVWTEVPDEARGLVDTIVRWSPAVLDTSAVVVDGPLEGELFMVSDVAEVAVLDGVRYRVCGWDDEVHRWAFEVVP